MGKKVLESKEVKEAIAKALVGGQSQEAIAQSLGVSQPTISRFAKREDVKALIEHEQMSLAEVIPDAVDNVKALVREMPDIPAKETKRRELSYKASTDVLKAVGLLPVPVQSQTLIWNSQTTIVSPVIERLLQQIQKSSDLPPLEVNFEEERE